MRATALRNTVQRLARTAPSAVAEVRVRHLNVWSEAQTDAKELHTPFRDPLLFEAMLLQVVVG